MPTRRELDGTKRKKEFVEFVNKEKEQAENEIKAVWDEDAPKQYIRTHAWLKVIQDYLTKKAKESADDLFKYLTFPGPNATDIGFLWRKGVIQRDDNNKLNVAICDKYYAKSVVMNLSNIGSLLAASQHQLHEALKIDKLLIDQFPFDIINLDFTNNISSAQSTKKSKHNRDAIGSVFRLQGGKSFVMLLTYRAINDEDSIAELLQIIETNITQEESFRTAYEQEYGTRDPRACIGDIHKFNQLAYAKLIARYARDFAYRTIEHFCGKYSRSDANGNISYYMMVQSFEFEKITKDPADKYRVRYGKTPKDEWDEKFNDKVPNYARNEATREYESCVIALLNNISTDVDSELLRDSRLKTQFENDSHSLIEWWKNP